MKLGTQHTSVSRTRGPCQDPVCQQILLGTVEWTVTSPEEEKKKSKAASESIKNVNLEEGEDIARLIGGGRRRGLVTPALAIHLRQRRPEIASSSVLRPESAMPASGSGRHLFELQLMS